MSKLSQRLYVPLCIVGLTALGVQLGRAAQAPATQQRGSQPGTQPTYFVEHPEHIQPGLQLQGRLTSLTNPFEGNAARIAEGGKLFIAYNCMDCHGADGSGAMGPSFQDNRWHFGGSAGEVFQSIYEGRPDGMPSWGTRIGDDQIWRLVAYIKSLPPPKDAPTEAW